MEETTLKQILDVVVDIKTEQTGMKQKIDTIDQRLTNVEAEQKEMKQVQEKMQAEQKEMKQVQEKMQAEQKEMKQVQEKMQKEQKEMKQVQEKMLKTQKEMYLDIKYLMDEQFDTKNIVIELVNKVGEMDLNTKRGKIYQFPKR